MAATKRYTCARWPSATLAICALLACQPAATLPPESARDVAATAARPEPTASGARVVQDEFAVSAGATLPPADLWCVMGPDPELERESQWSIETGRHLDRVLPRLASCTHGLPPGEHEITLRLVYRSDGTSTSQHVVRSSPGACAAASCLMRELGSVPSPPLLIDRNSYDIALALESGSARRVVEPLDALAADVESGASCVDPTIAALSRGKVKEVVSSAFPNLRSCYGEALMRDHGAAGNVTFEFVIGQAGKVSRAQIRDSTFPDCAAMQCMLQQFRNLEFPEPVGRSVRIVYPINYIIEQGPVTLR